MISRYGIFCKVIELGSFTKVADQLGYSQSAISQTIKSLEQEIGTLLISRKKDGMILTADGEKFLPYIQGLAKAEEAFYQKQQEFKGLEKSTIRIGTFTSVSRNILPALMKSFKKKDPYVNFVLQQGDYTSIENWLKSGRIDFGFINADATSGIETKVLYIDEMMAVLPEQHPLAREEVLSLHQLAKEPFILLDEGRYSVLRNAFEAEQLSPAIEYEVYDDYSILAMIRQGLGVSAIYQLVLNGFEEGLAIRPIKERPLRTVALAWQNWETMSYASRRFVEFIIQEFSSSSSIDLQGLTAIEAL